jgi:hypothetical protein
MATLTVATITPERVHLVLDNPTALNVGKVMRADVNGTRTLRTQTGQLPSTGASLDFYDYEAALNGAVTYTAYSVANAVIATASVTAAGPAHVLIIACPLYPTDGVVLAPGDELSGITFATTWGSTRAGRTTLHAVIGRTDPAAVLHAVASRAGDLLLICPDHPTCKEIESQLSLARTFMLRQSDVPGLDAYFVVTSLAARNHDSTARWELTVSMAEVAWPVGSFVPSSVWTYADLLAGYGDYNAVAAGFANYATLNDRQPLP